MALLIAWPGGALLQADEPEQMPRLEEKFYPGLREPSVDEAKVRDGKIQAAILTAYFKEEAIDPDRVDVKVDAGVVHLSGRVPSEDALGRAEEIASGKVNVVSVVNELEVDEDG